MKISCLDDIVQAVEQSSDVNVAQLVGTQEGDVLVPTYQWDSFLGDYFKKLIGVTTYQHFRFAAATPGRVFCKEYSDSKEVAVKLLRRDSFTPAIGMLPPIIPPQGLSLDRQTYLFEKIREFCDADQQDRVCPRPRQVLSTCEDKEDEEDNEEDEQVPPPKKQRLCGSCRQPGHTRRTCPQAYR